MPKQNGNVQKQGGLAREVDCAVLKALSVVYNEVTPEELQAFIGMKQPERIARLREAILGKKVLATFTPKMSAILGGQMVNVPDEFQWIWKKFYKEVLGLDLKEREDIPDYKQGFDFLMFITKSLTHKMISDGEKKLGMSTWKYGDDLDKDMDQGKEERNITKSYAIWIKDSIEVPKDLKNLSALDIEKQKIQTMTLLERRLLELFYFRLTKHHLDINSTTLCSGSRYSDGSVPGAGWSAGKFYVDWCRTSDSFSRLRARAVVS